MVVLLNMEFGYINYTKANGPLFTAPANKTYGQWGVDDISFVVGDQGDPFLYTDGKNAFTHAMLFGTLPSSHAQKSRETTPQQLSSVPSYVVTNQDRVQILEEPPKSMSTPHRRSVLQERQRLCCPERRQRRA